MSVQVRRLGPEDAAASQRLGWEAFGVPAGAPEPPETSQPGWRGWGVEDGGRLVAQAGDREYDGWFGGRTLPLAGVADVTVAAEARGRRGLDPLVRAMLEGAHGRGAVMSTLFPTAPRIYRRFGYESFATMRWVDVPSGALAALPEASGVVLRRAAVEDVPRVRALYAAWASGLDGTLTREGISFPATDAEVLGAVTGTTLAEDTAGRPLGYASWTRGPGRAGQPDLVVTDLVAGSREAYGALLRMLGSFASVAATVRLRTTGDDRLRLLLPTADWSPVHENLCMLKVLDVERAFTGARCATGLTLRSGFTVAGDVLADVNGSYAVEAEAGRVRCVRAGATDDRTLAPRGLALLVTGAAPCRDLRVLGLLTGGDPAQDADWDALVAGRVRGVLDYF